MSRFRPWGEIEDLFAPTDSPAVFVEAGFRFAAPGVEFDQSGARITTQLRAAAASPAQSTFPSAAAGRAACRHEYSPVSRFIQRLAGPASYVRTASPGLRAEAAFPISIDPPSLEPTACFAETDFQPFPAQAIPPLDSSLTAPMLPLAGSAREEMTPGDSGKAPASGFQDFRCGGIVLPDFETSGIAPPDFDADFAGEPRAVDFDGAETASAFRVLNGVNGSNGKNGIGAHAGIGRLPGVLLDPSPILYCANALAMPLAISGAGSPIAEPARFQFPHRLPNRIAAPDLGEFELLETARPPAGFVSEAPPSACPSICGYLHTSADFELSPVWLPALFTLSRPWNGFRTLGAFNPFRTPPLGIPDRPLNEAGPGFSGMLGLPLPGNVVRDSIEATSVIVDSPIPDSPLPPQQAAAPSSLRKAVDLWRSVSFPARCLALGIPLVASVLLFAPPITTPAGSPEWDTVVAKIRNRATVDLGEDFQSGLAAWTGKPGWESSWTRPGDGSAQPGRLALYLPTLTLRDYHFGFQGYIQSKGLGFVFRAADADNYYAAKFVVKKPGPLPSIALVRYAVIGGRATAKTEIPIPLYLREDTQYNTLVTVEGEHFTISINEQLVDAWSDSRLRSGGVGLFADKGEVAHYRSVQVVDQKDFLGWACSQVSTWTADRRTLGVNHE